VGKLSNGDSVDVIDANGQLQVKGELTFATARRAREVGLKVLEHVAARDTVVVDCSGVGESDSAGLAVLLEWLKTASAQGRSLQFVHLPAGIVAAARISEVDGILGV
jgi:phospholipid transport system transporter-binding protein